MKLTIVWPIVLLALGCEYVDSSLGMGYGTTLTPLLLLVGYDPMQVVPAVLLSEFLSGVTAGLLHHGLGNVDLRPGARPFQVAMTLAACSVAGTLVAVLIAVRIPQGVLKAYIGLLVLGMGLTILLTLGKTFDFSWKKVVALGLVAALNKGVSGGGYGPLVCAGQILSGVDEKAAISITSLAEGLVCLVGVVAYVATGGGAIGWELAPSLVLGALLSVPLATLTVQRVSLPKMRWAVGVAVSLLGIYTLSSVTF
jgi:hypothetical protein